MFATRFFHLHCTCIMFIELKKINMLCRHTHYQLIGKEALFVRIINVRVHIRTYTVNMCVHQETRDDFENLI